MLPNALKVEVKRRSKEKRPNSFCLSLCTQSARMSKRCAVVGSRPGAKKLGVRSSEEASQVAPVLHLGNSERNFNAMGLGLAMTLPGHAGRGSSVLGAPSGL